MMRFAFRFLKQALFGEKFLDEAPGALERRVERKRAIVERERARMRADMEKEQDAPDEGS